MQHLIHKRAMHIEVSPAFDVADQEVGALFESEHDAWVCANILVISPLFLAECTVLELRAIAHVVESERESTRSEKAVFDSVVGSSGLRVRLQSSFAKAMNLLRKYNAHWHVDFSYVTLAGWIRLVDLLGAEPYMISHLAKHGGNPSCGELLIAACRQFPVDPLLLVPYAEFLCYCTNESKPLELRILMASQWLSELTPWCSSHRPCTALAKTFLFQPKALYTVMEIQRQIGTGCVLQFGSVVSFCSHFVKHKMWFLPTLQGAKEYLFRANQFIKWSPPHKVTQRWSQDGRARILYIGDPDGELAIVVIPYGGVPVLATYYIAENS